MSSEQKLLQTGGSSWGINPQNFKIKTRKFSSPKFADGVILW